MKIAGIILATLMLLGSILVGVIGANKSMDAAEAVAAVSGELTDAQMEEAGIPSAGRLKTGGIVGIVAALGAFALLIVTFVKREKVLLVAGATMGLCVLAILLYPSMQTGPLDGMAPKTQAMVTAVLAALGAGGAFMAQKASKQA